MKRTITLVTFCCVVILMRAQNSVPFYDAIKLNSVIDPATKHFKLTPDADLKLWMGILNAYLPVTQRSTTWKPGELAAKFSDNPFLKNYLPTTADLTALGFSSSSPAIPFTNPAGAIGALGQMDVTQPADAVAIFLVGRFKEELNEAFFSKFTQALNDPKFEDLHILFPNTSRRLQNMGTQIYKYSVYLEDLRSDFQTDLKNMLVTFPQVLKSTKYQQFMAGHPDIDAIIQTGIYLLQNIKDNPHPASLIANYPVDVLGADAATNKLQNVKASVQTIQLLSQAMTDGAVDKTNYWVPADSLQNFVEDADQVQIFMGLLANQSSDIIFLYNDKTLHPLKQILFSQANNIVPYQDFLSGMINSISTFQSTITDFMAKKATDKNSINYTDYYDLYSASLGVLQNSAKALSLPGIYVNVNQADINSYFSAAQVFGNLYKDVNTKSYISVVMDVTTILNDVLAPIINDRSDHLKTLLATIDKQHPAAANAEIQNYAAKHKLSIDAAVVSLTKQSKIHYSDKLLNAISLYGSFMATVSRAKTSQDIAAAIEAVALPVGSSVIKKKTLFSVSLNCYVAPYYGGEWLKTNVTIKNADGSPKLDANSQKQYHDSTYQSKAFGFYAPVGIGLNVAPKPATGKGGSISLFFPLIDLGAFVSYRFKDDTSTLGAQVKVRLKDIFAPGVNLIYGIPNAPVSFGAGISWAPALTAVYTSGADVRNSTGFRAFAFIGVDIPAVNLYATKSRIKK